MTNSNDSTVWRLDSLTCTNFKAFSRLDIKINGRNVLIYGKNGSGKSSLYEAIKFFIDSATYTKPVRDVLLEKHTNITQKQYGRATISGSLWNGQKTQTLHVSNINPVFAPILQEGRLASDFITYRVLYDFYTHRENDTVNLWPIFYNEILPFCALTNSESEFYKKISELLEKDFTEDIQSKQAEIEQMKSLHESDADYSDTSNDIEESIDAVDEILKKLKSTNDELQLIINGINTEANKFYTKHFSDDRKIEINLGINEFTLDSNNKLTKPKLQLTITHSGMTNLNPLTYLNEATLTQIAISIRLGASLMMLNHDTHSTKSYPLKLLVIDDLLISLDMSNRMQVINILLGPDFADFQKIILTHDEAFFEEIRSRTYLKHTQWEIIEVNYEHGKGYTTKKDYLQKAEDYLYGYIDDTSADSTESRPDRDLDAAGVNMRKSAEKFVKEYSIFVKKLQQQPQKFIKPKKDSKEPTLANHINQVIQSTMNAIPIYLYYEYLRDITAEELRLVIPNHVHDVDENDKQRIRELREKLYKNFAGTPWRLVRNISILLQLDASRNRIMNNAAHDDKSPKYKEDFDETLKLLKMFTRIVHEPDMTAPLMRFEQSQIEPIDPAVEINPDATPPQPPVPPGARPVRQRTTKKANKRSKRGVSSFGATNQATESAPSAIVLDHISTSQSPTPTPRANFTSEEIGAWLQVLHTIKSDIEIFADITTELPDGTYVWADYGIALDGYVTPIYILNGNEDIPYQLAYKNQLNASYNVIEESTLGVFVVFSNYKLYVLNIPQSGYEPPFHKYSTVEPRMDVNNPKIHQWFYDELAKQQTRLIGDMRTSQATSDHIQTQVNTSTSVTVPARTSQESTTTPQQIFVPTIISDRAIPPHSAGQIGQWLNKFAHKHNVNLYTNMRFDLQRRYISIDYGITINDYLIPIQIINNPEKHIASSLAYNKQLISPLHSATFRTRGVYVIFNHINVYVIEFPEAVLSANVTKNLLWSTHVKKSKILKLDDPTTTDWLYNELVESLPK